MLRFDAAMLRDDPRDASTLRDAGPRDAPMLRDAGPPRDAAASCQGVVYPCSLVGTVNCSTQLGCSLDGDCSGLSTSCYSLFSSYACGRQDGCYWTSSRSECSGSARSCSSYFSSLSCGDQVGCSWRDECDGFAQPCSLLSESQCGRQIGCRWE